MADSTEVPSVSQQVEKIQRFSHPPSRHKKHGLRHTQSHNYGQHRPHVPPTIPEVEVTEEDVEMRPRSHSVRSQLSTKSSFSRKTPGRHELTINGYGNNGYEGPLPDAISSNLSSRAPSMQSIVQREQYCCKSNWSPCERKLAASVGVLAAIIIVLVIVVGVLAGHGDKGIISEKIRLNF